MLLLRCHGCGRNDANAELHVCNRCQRSVYCGAECALGAKCIGGLVTRIEPGDAMLRVEGDVDPLQQMNLFLDAISQYPENDAAREFFVSLAMTYGAAHYKYVRVGAEVRADLDRETGVAFPRIRTPNGRLQRLRAVIASGEQAEQPPNYESLVDLLQAFDSIERLKSTIVNRYTNLNLVVFYQAEIVNDFAFQPGQEQQQIEFNDAQQTWLREMRVAYDDLMSLTGLTESKRDVVRLIQSHMVRPFDTIASHRGIIAWGNPGTGKTEFTKKMAKLFYYFGLSIEDTASVKTKNDFTSQYLGGTASKTKRLIYNNLGSVIFFDEAYSLTAGADQYGLIALDTIVSLLSTYEGLVVIVLAGYVENITEGLLKVNPGMSSRFPYRILFENYTAPELWDITLQMLEKRNTGLTQGAANTIKSGWAVLVDQHKLDDENARAVDNFIKSAINIQRGLLPFNLGRQQRTQPLILSDQAVSLALQKLVKNLSPGERLAIAPDDGRAISGGPDLSEFTDRLPRIQPYTQENHPPEYLHLPRGGGNQRRRERPDNPPIDVPQDPQEQGLRRSERLRQRRRR